MKSACNEKEFGYDFLLLNILNLWALWMIDLNVK